MAHSTSSVIDDNPAYIENSTILRELNARELAKNVRVAWAVSSRSKHSADDRTLPSSWTTQDRLTERTS